jgi:beta-phosphoglucomutase-like phosphatase (HAD superfamily)
MGAKRGYHVIAARALLFDMDGLMVDSEPLWFRVQGDFVRSRGGRWTREQADQCTGRGLANALRVMGLQPGVMVDVERDRVAIVDAFESRVGELELKTGCRELLAFAAGRSVPRAVASSSAGRLIEAVLDRFDLLGSFDAVVAGEAVTRAKPAPDIFLAAAERLGVAPADCVVLEDSLAGVEAGRAAGMRVVAVPEKQDPRFAAMADAVVGDLHAAMALLDL